LLEETDHIFYGEKAALLSPVESLVYNSCEARDNCAFFCLVGARTDGHNFAKDAYEKGARIFFCERKLYLPHDCIQIIVKNSRAALARASAAFFGHPEKKLTLIGVTGTKGKSSVCEMISQIFACAGKKCATIGTLGIKIDGETRETSNSTPESFIIYRSLAEIAEKGIQYVAMEVSSQALSKSRVEGLHFAAAVFTNLSRDHIGTHEHPTFEHYKAAKKSLFSAANIAFINSDDTFAGEFCAACRCPVYTYGTDNIADIRAQNIFPFRSEQIFGTRFFCRTGSEKEKVILPLPGNFSVLNALAAIAVCLNFGVPLNICSAALANVSIRGRFETVPCARNDITCLIDYAHNAVSLEKALSTLQAYAPSRIICIFGSVGGRTKERRRELAEAAARLADICIITSDNPDFEEPEAIIEEIASYIPCEKCITEADRAKAVSLALDIAKSGDFLFFAGKGHEEYQLVRGKKLPFSERELIKNHIFKKKQIILFP